MNSISIELNAISFQISNEIFVRSRLCYCWAHDDGEDDDTIIVNILLFINFEAQKNLNGKFKLNNVRWFVYAMDSCLRYLSMKGLLLCEFMMSIVDKSMFIQWP